MINSRNKIRWKNVTYFERYERVDCFKYLRSIVAKNNETFMEVKARVAAGNKCYYRLKLLRSPL